MKEKTKVLLIICDGLGGRPVESMGGLTPLEVARTPNLDRLAANGISGLMDTIRPGVVPGSDVAHLAILGYDPYEVYTGRGPFEAAGVGIELKAGDIAFRCNFASVDDAGIVTDRRAGRIKDASPFDDVISAIELDDAKVLFKAGTEHRGALVLRGEGLSAAVGPLDPKKEGKPLKECKPLDDTPEAARTARILNQFSAKAREALEAHPLNEQRRADGKLPANAILIRGAGVVPHIPDFEERFELKAACISGAAFYAGIARSMGMDIVTVDGATGGLDTDVGVKITGACELLDKGYDMVFVHVKATDNLGHDGKAIEKAAMIERIDDALEAMPPEGTLLVLTGDHSTPCEMKNHSADPVPILMSGPGVRTDAVDTFGERPAMTGGLGRIRGIEVVPTFLGITGRAKKYGA
ncbi:MAG: 2,3-bisphosphoglycerate-independent phosphoglycerate mutase [Candidatus Undinarchaeales archaeon]|nr:2,3-bisphosphoglycerate-independent phosphoglycerate mutase [Candidatus Undinarchaeales archaeon]MDP7493011.1 2,3-bisphosphoglycerate-independent phosphoglycerate mutase [Candidatus Undinarchaeales archaeon]